MLEGFQAGLAWIVILRKREALPRRLCRLRSRPRSPRFGEADIERLMADPGIVRARAKIEATIAGARIYCDDARPRRGFRATIAGPSPTARSSAATASACRRRPTSPRPISKDLKGRGFKFVGPTIVYAWLQAVGIVDDHQAGCFRRTRHDAIAARPRRHPRLWSRSGRRAASPGPGTTRQRDAARASRAPPRPSSACATATR